MGKKGYRKVQTHGQISLPKEFRDKHDLEKGDKIFWKEHSRNNLKLIISTEPFKE